MLWLHLRMLGAGRHPDARASRTGRAKRWGPARGPGSITSARGFGILRRIPVALGTTVLAVGAVLAISPMQGVVLPAFFVQRDAPGLLGLTLCAVAVGLIAGSLLYAAARAADLAAARCCCWPSASRWWRSPAFAIAPVVPVVIPAAVLIGFGFGTLNPMFPVLDRRARSRGGAGAGARPAERWRILVGYPIGVLLAGVIVQAGGVQLGVVVPPRRSGRRSRCSGLLWPGLRQLEKPAGEVSTRE